MISALVGLAAVATDPTFSVNQVLEDTVVAAGSTTPGEKDALAFPQMVQSAAAARGIGSADIFVTGHSLGAIQAEYVAQQTRLGCIGFEPTGIPRSSTTAGHHLRLRARLRARCRARLPRRRDRP